MKEVHIYRGCEHYIVEQQAKKEKKRGRSKGNKDREQRNTHRAAR